MKCSLIDFSLHCVLLAISQAVRGTWLHRPLWKALLKASQPSRLFSWGQAGPGMDGRRAQAPLQTGPPTARSGDKGKDKPLVSGAGGGSWSLGAALHCSPHTSQRGLERQKGGHVTPCPWLVASQSF